MQRQCRLVQQSIAAARRSAALGQQPVRWISSPAEALSYHPSASGSASTSTPTASSSATASTAPSPSESQTSRAERTLRRFWKDVHLHQDAQSGEWTIMLDKRTLKTPSGKKLALPKHKRLAAAVIAHEWDSQKTLLKPHSLPLTSLVSRALEGLSDEATRPQVIEALTRYLHTDTVLFHESKSASLTSLQDAHWVPLIQWVNETFGSSIKVADENQLFMRQSPEDVQKLQAVVSRYDPFTLAGFERAVMASKSFIIGLGLAEGRLTADEAAKAAHVEVQSQIDRWGEVEDTHDVDHQDVRVRLGSASLVISRPSSQK